MTKALLKKEKETHGEQQKTNNEESGKYNTNQSSPGSDVESDFVDSKGEMHKSVLKMDATCADAEVRYPIDVDIIHDGCKVVDRYVAHICKTLVIGRIKTSYKKVHRWYLELVLLCYVLVCRLRQRDNQLRRNPRRRRWRYPRLGT